MIVLFGNATPAEATPGLDNATDAVATVSRRRWYEGDTLPIAESVALFDIPDTDSLIDEVLPTITRTWAASHSSDPPVWVASTNSALAEMLSANYGCPIGDVDSAMSQYQAIEAKAHQAQADGSTQDSEALA